MLRTTRLNTISPSVDSLCGDVDAHKVRRAALSACRDALVSTDSDAWTLAVLTSMADGKGLASGTADQIRSRVAEMDDRYVALYENEDAASRAEAMRWFSRARALAALGFLVSDSLPNSKEAIYEAAMAFEDQKDILRRVEAELRA